VDPAQWLASYNENLARAANGAQAVGDSLRQADGRATSPRGEVEARVNSGGVLEDLRLTPAARTLEADDLARLILQTVYEAQRVAGAQVAEIMTEYLGEGPALELVKQNLPAAEPVSVPPTVNDDDYFAQSPGVTE
jgi:hypothetical protein